MADRFIDQADVNSMYEDAGMGINNIIDRSINNTNLITFDETKFNLSNFTTKTTIAPKIQEQPTSLLIKCMRNIYKYDVGFIERNLNCNENSISAVNEEIYKRLISNRWRKSKPVWS